MAKKIRLDFSKVEERAGWNTRHIPEGLHSMKITAVVDKDANDGTAMWTYALVPESAKFKTRRFPYYCKLQPNQLFKVRDLFIAAGVPVPKKAQLLEPEKVLNKIVAVEVEDDEYNGSIRSQVAGVYSTDILEGDEPEPQDDEEEDEEGEEEDYEDDGEDEEEEADEEDEEDEEDEDLESLTLAELRKRVKDLGESTAGLKKADLIAILEGDEDEDEEDDEEDDEDLDEEELYEDEDEEDEEEEEPAPRRRPAARKPAPAKAAPARKAAAPAAKRTVKRR